MIQLVAIYRRHPLDSKIQTDYKLKGEKIYIACKQQSQQATVAIQISDKTYFKQKMLLEIKRDIL